MKKSIRCMQSSFIIELLLQHAYSRASKDMDGTLKFPHYKVGGHKTPIALLIPNIFFEKKNVKLLS